MLAVGDGAAVGAGVGIAEGTGVGSVRGSMSALRFLSSSTIHTWPGLNGSADPSSRVNVVPSAARGPAPGGLPRQPVAQDHRRATADGVGVRGVAATLVEVRRRPLLHVLDDDGGGVLAPVALLGAGLAAVEGDGVEPALLPVVEGGRGVAPLHVGRRGDEAALRARRRRRRSPGPWPVSRWGRGRGRPARRRSSCTAHSGSSRGCSRRRRCAVRRRRSRPRRGPGTSCAAHRSRRRQGGRTGRAGRRR